VIGAENIEDWRGQQVIDPDGEPLGKLDDVLFDADSGTPLLISIKRGLLGRKSALVPIADAIVAPNHVRVAHRKAEVDRAGADGADGVPDSEQLNALGSAYGLRFADRVRLESAGARDTARAESEAAHARAEQLEAEAGAKAAAEAEAHDRALQAGEHAGQAGQEAEAARRAAQEARERADRYGHH
jgi:sporulation protein YlmC with PRC-barrel domain